MQVGPLCNLKIINNLVAFKCYNVGSKHQSVAAAFVVLYNLEVIPLLAELLAKSVDVVPGMVGVRVAFRRHPAVTGSAGDGQMDKYDEGLICQPIGPAGKVKGKAGAAGALGFNMTNQPQHISCRLLRPPVVLGEDSIGIRPAFWCGSYEPA